MSPKRAQPKSRQSRDEPGEVLNSPFRYAEDTTEERSVAEESAPSPTVFDIPLAPNPESFQYLLKTVERMQSRLFFMERLFQEQSLAVASTGDTVPTTEAVTPEPPVAEVPFILTARVDTPAATGKSAVSALDEPLEQQMQREKSVADYATEALEHDQAPPVATLPYAGHPHYSTAFSLRINKKHPRQMGRNDITRVFEMQLKRGYTPMDLLSLEDRWATFCRYPAPQHLWATILDPDLAKDLCSYFQMTREKFESCSNSMVALLLQLFVSPRDVSYFLGYLKAVKVETKGHSAPSFDTTLPVATFTTEFNLLYMFLAESVRSPHIQPVIVGGGDNPDTVYKVYLRGLGVYGTYIKTLIDQNKLPKLSAHKASYESFIKWTDIVINTIQVNNNKLEELSVFVDAREAVLRGAKADLLAVASFEPLELDSDFGLEDIAVLCPLSGETKRVFPCTTTCLGNICKRSFCRNSHDRADLIVGVDSLRTKIEAVIAGGYKFLAPIGPSPTPSQPPSAMRSAARSPAR
jgi:hypothetical protein